MPGYGKSNQRSVGPGWLFGSALGVAEPSHTSAVSKFTDSWINWYPLGYTDEGNTFETSVDTGTVDAAEEFYPLATEITGITASVQFGLLQVNPASMKFANNGGQVTVLSGTGATAVNAYEPPDPTEIVRVPIGWQSFDGTERMIWRQVLNTGNVSIARKKAPDKAIIPCEFSLEQPTGKKPWIYLTAGTSRDVALTPISS